MFPFCIIETSAELEAINSTVSPLNSPACFVSQTAASLNNAFIGQRESDSQLVLVCYRARDTWTNGAVTRIERWVFTRQKKRPAAPTSPALRVGFCFLRCALFSAPRACILLFLFYFFLFSAADLRIVRSPRLPICELCDLLACCWIRADGPRVFC